MGIKVEKPTQQFLEDRKVSSWGIREKEVSRFDWHYDAHEECCIPSTTELKEAMKKASEEN